MLKSPYMFTIAVVASLLAAPAFAQDATAGKKTFKKCVACHAIGEGAKNKVGPVLTDVIGRQAGTGEGYQYGKDMVLAGEKGLLWTQELLAEYLEDPKQFLRDYLEDSGANSKMSFKLKDDKERADVAAYLASQGPDADASTQPTADQAQVDEAEAETPEMSVEDVIAAQEFSEAYLTDPKNIEAGKEFWYAQCTHCHGFKAYPGKAPKLKPAKYKPEFVFKRVYKGFRKMPAWRDTYTVEEIRQIVSYVKAAEFSP